VQNANNLEGCATLKSANQYYIARMGAILEPARGALTIKNKQDGNEDIAAPRQQDNT